jgi:hypothetical protein
MTDERWEYYPCRAERTPDGIITLHGLEPGFEYSANVNLFMGYSVVSVMRRKASLPPVKDTP